MDRSKNLGERPNLAQDGLLPKDLTKRRGRIIEVESDPIHGSYVWNSQLRNRWLIDYIDSKAFKDGFSANDEVDEAGAGGDEGKFEKSFEERMAETDRALDNIGAFYRYAALAILAAIAIDNIQEIKRTEIFQTVVAPVLKELGIQVDDVSEK